MSKIKALWLNLLDQLEEHGLQHTDTPITDQDLIALARTIAADLGAAQLLDGDTVEQLLPELREAYGMGEPITTPADPAPAAVPDTGGFVAAWLRPGDELHSGGTVPDGRFGMRLTGGDTELTATSDELSQLGDAIAARWQSKRTQAVIDLAEVFDTILPGEGVGFGSLTCSEANRLAEMFAVFGHFDSAVNVVLGHCFEDDGGNEHGYIAALDEPDGNKAYEAAQVYMRRQMGDTDAQPTDHEAKRTQLAELREAMAAAGDDVDDEVRDQVAQLRQELGEDA